MLARNVIRRRIVLWFVAGLFVGVVALSSWGVSGFLKPKDNFTAARETKSKFIRAPELGSGTWINSEPLRLTDLRGRVVLLDFWTFGCYNCRNTLPFVKSWHKKYADSGLTIIGVHSPELDNERDVANVRREVASLEIRYPVVTDNDYSTWKAYSVEAWPTVFLLDKEGQIRWSHVGEGAYDEAEKEIKQLIAEDSKKLKTEN